MDFLSLFSIRCSAGTIIMLTDVWSPPTKLSLTLLIFSPSSFIYLPFCCCSPILCIELSFQFPSSAPTLMRSKWDGTSERGRTWGLYSWCGAECEHRISFHLHSSTAIWRKQRTELNLGFWTSRPQHHHPQFTLHEKFAKHFLLLRRSSPRGAWLYCLPFYRKGNWLFLSSYNIA